MKVLCIEGGFIPCINNPSGKGQTITEGAIYTVLEEDTFLGRMYYVLVEFGTTEAFDSELFAPISDIDETEMVREYQLLKTEA